MPSFRLYQLSSLPGCVWQVTSTVLPSATVPTTGWSSPGPERTLSSSSVVSTTTGIALPLPTASLSAAGDASVSGSPWAPALGDRLDSDAASTATSTNRGRTMPDL